MAVRLDELLVANFQRLRYQPLPRRIRGLVGDESIVDSERAVLVWEARHVIPSFAVPDSDIRAQLVPAAGPGAAGDMTELAAPGGPGGGSPIVRPGSFTTHTGPGEELTLVLPGGARRERAAFRFAGDSPVAGLVELDFGAFDRWLEEDDEILAHPRDPYHRIDVRRTGRRIRIWLDGTLLADSTRPRMLFETHLPVRFYLPPDDVRTELLRPSDTRTACAYKGWARYWSVQLAGQTVPDVVWSYPHPLAEAADVAGYLAFFDERLDVELDGVRRPRPRTPWSRPPEPPPEAD